MEMSADVEEQPTNIIKSLMWYSLALNESTDRKDSKLCL